MTRLRYSIDTRTIQPGEFYVAIRGERYDGHDFIPEAITKGAIGLIVEKDVTHLAIPPYISVNQVDESIHYLAKKAYRRIEDLQPTAVTGSVGKTTTKNAITTVLCQVFPVVTPRGNLNTLLGLSECCISPTSIARAPFSADSCRRCKHSLHLWGDREQTSGLLRG